jgi:PAS domain S-box-containing protein
VAAFTMRRLPDVVVVQMPASEALEVLARLSDTPSTCDIPVVVLTSSLTSTAARRARALGGMTLLPHLTDLHLLVDDVETLVAAAPRAQRTLKRRLLDLQDVARHYTRDASGPATFRHLINRLQVAMFAADEQGQCVAASQGATRLTGYSHGQLLTTSVFQAEFAGGWMSDGRWRDFLVKRQYAGTTTITTRAGEDVTVYAAAAAEILPGFHVAAVVAAA